MYWSCSQRTTNVFPLEVPEFLQGSYSFENYENLLLIIRYLMGSLGVFSGVSRPEVVGGEGVEWGKIICLPTFGVTSCDLG